MSIDRTEGGVPMNGVYVIDAARTPRGRGKAGKGALSGVHPQELVAQILRKLPERTGFDRKMVDDVIVGVVSQVNEQGSNLARNAVLAAGWPIEVSGVSLNRFCGSGLQAVSFAAMAVGSGAADLVVAAGVESMSRVPMGSDGGGIDGQNELLRERFLQVPQGLSADLIATKEGITRAEVDEIALRSQQRAAVAIEQGRFSKSLVPVVDPKTGKVLLSIDESPRPDTTIAGLSGLAPSFTGLAALLPNEKIDHVHTAGNSSGIADGAGAVVLASERWVKEHGIRPRARIRATTTLGSDPILMLTAPAPTSEKVLRKAGMKASDIDHWEINEAFAAVVIETTRKLGIDPAKVNPNGGAIALGHPLGATGTVLLGTALDELERSNQSTALITMCIGGGQGIATIIERV
jgi:acetyl-CoA C-acetyltransferase